MSATPYPQDVESLAIDVPIASDELTTFLARAVIDGVVSQDYLDDSADGAGLDPAARRVAASARAAITAPGGTAHSMWRSLATS